MFRVILILLSISIYAQDEKVFDDLKRFENNQTKPRKRAKERFVYTKNKFKPRTYRSVVFKNAIIDSLDGKSKLQVRKNTIVRTREVYAGSTFLEVLNNSGEAIGYVESDSTRHIDEILTFYKEDKFEAFSKERFSIVEFDKRELPIYIQLEGSFGTSSPSFLVDDETLSTLSFGVSTGVETFKNVPFFLGIEYLGQSNVNDVSLNSFIISMALEYRYLINKDSFFSFGIGAGRSIYSTGDAQGTSIGHSLESLNLNLNYNYSSYFIKTKISKIRYNFDSGVFFPGSSITDENNATSIALSIGKEFESSL